ncbi:dTDP-4-dehydrorhamnose reductase [Amylibacter sp.]|nr:dTDP-4-dehydrorhamnose reductase [Amylibacter sp.]
MKVLLFGKTGQVAKELCNRPNVTAIGRDTADFTKPKKIIEIVKSTDADIIINAVAYTAVDLAEDEFQLANIVNGTTVTEIAKVAAKRNIPFLHISSDYVFNGNGSSSWKTNDPTNPQNSYGRSKLIGESGILAAAGPYVILRTSWVFSSHGNNFVKTMVRLASNNPKLSIVNDQVGGPTWAVDIANTLWKIASDFYAGNGTTGIYHFTGKPNSSWANFAAEIFLQTEQDIKIEHVLTKDFLTKAKRPLNSRLDCSSLKRDYGIEQPEWRKGLSNVLNNLT